jgi:MFS family permease
MTRPSDSFTIAGSIRSTAVKDMSNVAALVLAQVLNGSGLTAVVLFGGILSAALAPDPTWATAPVAIAVVGMALSTVPASLLMREIGRKAGLVLGSICGVIASLLAAYGIASSSFLLFCTGALLFGTASAFTMQYRFVAAESVPVERMSQAISYVLLGGLGAALIGPQAATAARAWLPQHEYAGSFLLIGLLYTLGTLVLCTLRQTAVAAQAVATGAPSVRALLGEPLLRRAVFGSAVAFVVMSFIMTAAPVSMHSLHHHDVQAITWTIQSHILAMYLPSLFSGKLIARFGERKLMLAGSALLAASVLTSLLGHDVPHYWLGLVLLGCGWNFLFTAGTALLATHYSGPERHRAQALNDFVVFGSQAIVSLLAGFAVSALGWLGTNLIVLPLLTAMIWQARRDAPPPIRSTG